MNFEQSFNVNLPWLLLRFDGSILGSSTWFFESLTPELYVRVSEPSLAFFLTYNYSDFSIYAISLYTIAPVVFSSFIIKIQCFCFSEQELPANCWLELPILLYVDKDIYLRNEFFHGILINLNYIFYLV